MSVREVYEERDRRLPLEDWRQSIYHPRHPVGRLIAAHNRTMLVEALNALDLDLADLRVLDVGCGTGHWLREFVDLGANPANLAGIDISAERLAYARRANPAITFVETTEEDPRLPFDDAACDLVMQTVVFSSIHDPEQRAHLASEMQRVTHRYLLWVDLRHTEARHVRAFAADDVAALFPAMRVVYKRPCHPRYFRRWYQHQTLCTLLSRLTRWDCEATLYVFEHAHRFS